MCIPNTSTAGMLVLSCSGSWAKLQKVSTCTFVFDLAVGPAILTRGPYGFKSGPMIIVIITILYLHSIFVIFDLYLKLMTYLRSPLGGIRPGRLFKGSSTGRGHR